MLRERKRGASASKMAENVLEVILVLEDLQRAQHHVLEERQITQVTQPRYTPDLAP